MYGVDDDVGVCDTWSVCCWKDSRGVLSDHIQNRPCGMQQTCTDARMVTAEWAPDSSCCLLIMSPSAHSAVLYFTSTHPSLEVQFLPLVLQGFGATHSKGTRAGGGWVHIVLYSFFVDGVKIVWQNTP